MSSDWKEIFMGLVGLPVNGWLMGGRAVQETLA
jgi:hypothetical protein